MVQKGWGYRYLDFVNMKGSCQTFLKKGVGTVVTDNRWINKRETVRLRTFDRGKLNLKPHKFL